MLESGQLPEPRRTQLSVYKAESESGKRQLCHLLSKPRKESGRWGGSPDWLQSRWEMLGPAGSARATSLRTQDNFSRGSC